MGITFPAAPIQVVMTGTGGAVVYESGANNDTLIRHVRPRAIVATNNPTNDQNKSSWMTVETGSNRDVLAGGTFFSIEGPL